MPVEGDLREIKLESQVVLTLKDGTRLEETVHQSHGNPQDPLSEAEVGRQVPRVRGGLGARSAAQRGHHRPLLPPRLARRASRELGDAVGSGTA